MNIIFESQLLPQIAEKYTVLELDTVMQPKLQNPIKLFAVVESLNIQDLSALDFFKNMHTEMIKSYKNGEWQNATALAKSLVGQFGGEIDEFYQRVIDFSDESAKIGRTWDGILHTTPSEEATE